ncbi:phenylacetate--CoA ligase family protein [Galbibacter sp. BG1]|uniref:phenylacetate--CoA ligase family protein n=1 Tax=Galbibacter sp. BG1 TaxID=1170699 RepID=UPI0015B839E7|nr:phenylacetate--CoA ligase family protein [Galbibacter sp. BG1]QLE02508.1 phenylacetate--CoA ligase family protein [Galbibacter sp. BG1]
MGLSNTLRERSFWALDFLKGAKIKKNYRDVRFILENFSDPKSVIKRKERLDTILNHARTTVPYYQNLQTLDKLSDFPVVNKNMIRDNFEAFKSNLHLDDKLYSRYTSGSTGTPFRIYHDVDKTIRNTADTLYFAKKAGFKVGQKLIYIRHWDQYNRKSNLATFAENILMHPVSNLRDKDIEGLLRKIQSDKSPKAILSYASALTTICNYLDRKNFQPLEVNMKSIIAMSEYLSPTIKQKLKYYFGVEGLSRYSNVENGIIAQQFPGSAVFHINWASYLVEVLKENSNDPAENGEPGRIVITDFFNSSMPLIRYDTGDIGYMETDDTFNGAPYLKRIEGRKMDMIYNTDGELITSYITYHLLKYPKIKQFQFIQEGATTYTLKLNVYDDFDYEEKIIEEFKTHLGKTAKMNITYVKDIPLLLSGKRKLVINKMIPQKAKQSSPSE